MTTKRPPSIVAAAIKDAEGKVWTLPSPCRHSDIICHRAKFGAATIADCVQGFITDSGTFVNRSEAYRIAKDAGQIIKRDDVTETPGTLYTEDLW